MLYHIGYGADRPAKECRVWSGHFFEEFPDTRSAFFPTH